MQPSGGSEVSSDRSESDRSEGYRSFQGGRRRHSLEDIPPPPAGFDDGDLYEQDDYEQEMMARANIRAMKRELRAVGVFDTYRTGAAERRRLRADLGFSRSHQLALPSVLPLAGSDEAKIEVNL